MKYLPTFFRVAAFSNWLLAAVTLFQKLLFAGYGLEPPRYPTLIFLAGMLAIVMGLLYWDIAEKPKHRLALLKIGLISKAGGSFIWLAGLLTRDLPLVFLSCAIWADLIWLPGFIYYYVRLNQESRFAR